MPQEQQQTLGIVAGGGRFPFMVAAGARASGMRVAAVAISGHTDSNLAEAVDSFTEVNIGQLGKLLKFLKKEDADIVTLAGRINKPKALSLRPDLRAAKLIFSLKNKGDDSLLGAVIAEIEADGFTVVQAADLVPGLRGPAGVITKRQPSKDEWADLRFGWSVAKALGKLDIGQCVVVRSAMVAAVEAMEGTDAAIARGMEMAGEKCTVVKVVKPNQEERIDLPSLGVETVRALVDGKAACLGYEAGKTLFFDRDEAMAMANAAGLCIIGLDPAQHDLDIQD